MIPLEEARNFVLEHLDVLASHRLALADALGCVATEDVLAAEPLPAIDVSAMDGYALQAADVAEVPAQLHVSGTQMAGMAVPDAITSGQALRIMTGAAVPPGADAVVVLERTVTSDRGDTVEVGEVVAAGANIRRSGEVIGIGDIVVTAGTMLTPAHAGILSSIGITSASVVPHPRVGVLSTGNELRDSGQPVLPGQIRDANRPTLLAWVRRAGWTAVDLGTIDDDLRSITQALSEAGAHCDAILTTGGVSVGDLDLMGIALERSGGGTARSMHVALKPGKPFAFATLADSGVPVFGLPGNPAAALVSAELLVRPALRLMSGRQPSIPDPVTARTSVDLTRVSDGKLHAMWAVVAPLADGVLSVRPCGTKGSHDLVAAAAANALILLPDGPGVTRGGNVPIVPLDDPLR